MGRGRGKYEMKRAELICQRKLEARGIWSLREAWESRPGQLAESRTVRRRNENMGRPGPGRTE